MFLVIVGVGLFYELVVFTFSYLGRHAHKGMLHHPKGTMKRWEYLVAPTIIIVSLFLSWIDLPHYRALGGHGGPVVAYRIIWFVCMIGGVLAPFAMIASSRRQRIIWYVIMFFGLLALGFPLIHYSWMKVLQGS